MESRVVRTIFFASVIWLAGAILTRDALGLRDTVVYAVRSDGPVGTIDLNSGVFTQSFQHYRGRQPDSASMPASSMEPAERACDCLFQINPATAAITPAPHTFHQNNNNFGAQNGFGSTTAGLFIIGAAAGSVNILLLRQFGHRRPNVDRINRHRRRRRHRESFGFHRFEQAVLGGSNQLHRYAL